MFREVVESLRGRVQLATKRASLRLQPHHPLPEPSISYLAMSKKLCCEFDHPDHATQGGMTFLLW